MNANIQIESLNKELKETLVLIEMAQGSELDELEAYANELKTNIEELSSKAEIDYERLSKYLLFRAAENVILYHILKRPELQDIANELLDIGVPRKVLTADREVLVNYLKQIEHPNPYHYERYSNLIRIVQSKSYIASPALKQELLKDQHWLMNPDSLGTQIMESAEIDANEFKRIISNLENEEFEPLVDRYLRLQTLSTKVTRLS